MEEMPVFKKLCKFLKEKADCSHPIKIHRVSFPKKTDGLCEFKKNHYLIRLNKDLDQHALIDAVLHEVAHAMSWGKDQDIHGPAWGIAYSKIYRKYIKEFSNELFCQHKEV